MPRASVQKDLVAGFEPAKDRDRRFHSGFFDCHGLEATLESRILTNGLSVFIRCDGIDLVHLQ